ncbi:3'-5' exonuclease [Hymenobacter setariae]|uniref:3'-5' exonuclease n=1 Tax=Hymenobacter setariae TaxID=2594794 RepID=UPI001F2FF6DA|nr:3'-5' exonuclease [Hymenobacter setariae]
MLSDFTIVDLETTGLDPVAGRITEIAARRYRNGKLSGAMSALVWAGVDPEPEAIKLNGLTSDNLERHGITEWQALEMLQKLLGTSVLVAHNAAFEMAWLNQACWRWQDAPFAQPFLCTKTLAVGLKAGSGRSYSLKQLTHDYNIVWTGVAHRAMPDVQATKALLDILCHSEQHFAQAGPLLTELLNCCGTNPNKALVGAHYPLPAGLPDHAKEVKQ